jgi:30S ribosomal protein S31
LLFLLLLHSKQKKAYNMGRGDKRTKRGKITLGSFGKSRLARATKKNAPKAEKKS